MLDGDFIQFFQPLRLGNTIVDHDGVDILHVGDADELVDGGIVALVAFERLVRYLPLLVRHAGFIFKLVEFDYVRIRIMQLLPKAEKRDCHLGTHPIPHDICREFGILETGNIRKTDEV